jgi:hypothetical protein
MSLILAAMPSSAQFLKKLEQELVGGQQQTGQPAQPTLLGTVNLPPGQYLMTNVQSGQAFYVLVQGGQMYLSNQAVQQPQQQGFLPGVLPGQGLMPGQNGQGLPPGQQQQGGMGGFVERGLGNFLKNEIAPNPGQ